MAETGQDFTMYAGERKTIRFAGTDQDDGTALDYATDFAEVKWALTSINPSTGEFSTTPVLEKKSQVAQTETGGNEIDFSGTGNNQADVQLINADTDTLAGEYYQELEGFDANGEGVVLATGTITIIRNVENT